MQPTGTAPTVRVSGLSARYRSVTALAGLSFALGDGVTALLGPNGAGKSTLMRILAGIDRPHRGTVDIAKGRTRRAERRAPAPAVGYLPQAFGFWPHFTLLEFLVYLAWNQGIPRTRRSRAAEAALGYVDLWAQRGTPMKKLSGGMLRRAGIAQAVMADPAVVLLDEPAAGLDPEQRLVLRELVVKLGRDRTVLMSTHLVDDLPAVCDAVLVLHEGRLVFTGGLDGFLAHGAGATATESPQERAYRSLLVQARAG